MAYVKNGLYLHQKIHRHKNCKIIYIYMVITLCIKNTKYILFLIKSTVSIVLCYWQSGLSLILSADSILSYDFIPITTLVSTSWCKRSALRWLILQYSGTNLLNNKNSFPTIKTCFSNQGCVLWNTVDLWYNINKYLYLQLHLKTIKYFLRPLLFITI